MTFKKLITTLIVICYFSFLYIDLFRVGSLYDYSGTLKYFSIILCFLNTLFIGKTGHDIIDTRLLQSAMLMTLIADCFLLVTQNFTPGIFIFCLIQIIYIKRHSRYAKFNYKLFLLTALVLVIFSIIIKPALINVIPLFLTLGTIYAILSGFSILTALSTLKCKLYPKKTAIPIILGLCLLFICDINVALFNFNPDNNISGFLMWFFYLPSQLLLSKSGGK